MLTASERHIAYVFKGTRASETTQIKFGSQALHAVMFRDVAVDDYLAVVGSSTTLLDLAKVDQVDFGSGLGGYVALLQDGGSPIVEGALMSMSSVVDIPGPVQATAGTNFSLRLSSWHAY